MNELNRLQELQDEIETIVASVNPDEAYQKFELACQSGIVPARQVFASQIAIEIQLGRLLKKCQTIATGIEMLAEEIYIGCCSDLKSHIDQHTSVPEYRRLKQKCVDALEIQKKVTAELCPRVDELSVQINSDSEEWLRKQLTTYENLLTGRKRQGICDERTEQAERLIRLYREALEKLQTE